MSSIKAFRTLEIKICPSSVVRSSVGVLLVRVAIISEPHDFVLISFNISCCLPGPYARIFFVSKFERNIFSKFPCFVFPFRQYGAHENENTTLPINRFQNILPKFLLNRHHKSTFSDQQFCSSTRTTFFSRLGKDISTSKTKRTMDLDVCLITTVITTAENITYIILT